MSTHERIITPWYDKTERMWCVYYGRPGRGPLLRDNLGAIRYFVTADEARRAAEHHA